MRAVRLALSHFREQVQNHCVLLSTDNTTVVSYIKKQGATQFHSLFLETNQVFALCLIYKVNIQTKHIPGKLNVLVDSLSRNKHLLQLEWSLNCQPDFQGPWKTDVRPLCNKAHLLVQKGMHHSDSRHVPPTRLPLSGRPSERNAFLLGLLPSSRQPLDSPLQPSTTQNGRSLPIGTHAGKLIHSIPLLDVLMSKSSSMMVGVRSKSRSLGQIFVKSCLHSKWPHF